MPIMATKRPIKPAIQPLRGSLGAVRLPHIMMPKMANQTNSKDWKDRATLPIMGVKIDMAIIAMTEPRKEPVVAIPIALPA
jgi:hypothetical protein